MNLETLMNKMLLSCKEATSLIEKQAVFPLTFVEKCRLYIHLKWCWSDNNRQTNLLRRQLKMVP